MRCPSCESDNAIGANFCDSCGKSLPLPCPVCETPNRVGARFCNACGAVLGQQTSTPVSRQSNRPPQSDSAVALASAVAPQFVPEGERKMVTAIFVDITGSTKLEQDLDPEE